jgi:hypothetical protein
MTALERFLAGVAILLSAALVLMAYLFQYDYAGAFQRLTWSLGAAFGCWVAAGVVAALIAVGAHVLRVRAPLTELYFALVSGAVAVAILTALR